MWTKHLLARSLLIKGFFAPLLLLSVLLSSYQVQAETFEVNFRDTDIQELIKFVADRTKKTIVVDPKVKGKVKVISSKRVNEEELYDLFLAILEVHGYSAIEAGGVIRLVPSKEARSQPVRVAHEDIHHENAEVITYVLQLENVNASKLIPILRPLVPQQAHMAAYAESNAIIMSDTAANIARIKEIIHQIDKSSFQEVEVVRLSHASAEEVVRILEKLEVTQAGTNAKTAPENRIELIADKRTNGIIISGNPSSRQRIKALIKHLDSPLEFSGNAKVVYLRYAKAEELAETLTKVTQNMSTIDAKAKGKVATSKDRDGAIIEADASTNALIITADADVMQALESIIARLDIRRAQVLVEAIIVEIKNAGDKDLGIEWMFSSSSDGFGGFTSNGKTTPIAGALTQNDPIDKAAGLAGALAGSAGGNLGVGRLKESGAGFIALLNAFQSDSDTNILSTPSLLTMDNNEASIVVGEEVPFITGSYSSTGQASSNPGNPFQTIERRDVGITLKVTPHINEGNAVILELEQEVSGVSGAGGAADLRTEQRKITTSVITSDGGVVVLGGLIKDEVRETETKVPLLGDIPLLGRLFRSNATDVVKTNLMVFIRPTIIRDDEKLGKISADKYSYIRDRQLEKHEEGISLYPGRETPVLPEWEEQIQKIEAIKASMKEEQAGSVEDSTQAK